MSGVFPAPAASRRYVQKRLEEGRFGGFVGRSVARIWEACARPIRFVDLPRRCAVVGVAGPTLGGSYKTPVAIELARALASRGARVALVAHGYGARAAGPHVVEPGDPVRYVGDDALAACRALAGSGVPVVVARRRAAALRQAAGLAPTLIVDSLLQTRPERLGLSVLVLDDRAPWGAGMCPPAGDLRAGRRAMVEAADVLLVKQGLPVEALGPLPGAVCVLRFSITVVAASRGDGRSVGLDELRRLKVGVVLAIARPERVLRALTDEGVDPVRVHLLANHSAPAPRRRSPGARSVDVWLTTSKCATKIGPGYRGAPVLVLTHRILLPPDLLRRAAQTALPAAPSGRGKVPPWSSTGNS